MHPKQNHGGVPCAMFHSNSCRVGTWVAWVAAWAAAWVAAEEEVQEQFNTWGEDLDIFGLGLPP